MEARAHLNRIGTAVPDHDVHAGYVAYAREALGDTRARRSFERLLARAQIDHRYAVVPVGFYGKTVPDTGMRMKAYEERALALAERAMSRIAAVDAS